MTTQRDFAQGRQSSQGINSPVKNHVRMYVVADVTPYWLAGRGWNGLFSHLRHYFVMLSILENKALFSSYANMKMRGICLLPGKQPRQCSRTTPLPVRLLANNVCLLDTYLQASPRLATNGRVRALTRLNYFIRIFVIKQRRQ